MIYAQEFYARHPETFWSLFIVVFCSGFVILTIAILAQKFLMRKSSAVRFHLWTASLLGLIAFPFLALFVPNGAVMVPEILPKQSGGEYEVSRSLEFEPKPETVPIRTPVFPAIAAANFETSFENRNVPKIAETILSDFEPPVFSASSFLPEDFTEENPVAIAEPIATPMIQEDSAQEPIFEPIVQKRRNYETGKSSILLIWFVGIVVSVLFIVRSLISELVLLTTSKTERFEDVRPLAEEIARKIGLKRRFALVKNERHSIPFVAGLFRTTVFLPNDFSQQPCTEQKAVLIHELTHILRRDLFWDYLTRCIGAVHWFNPLFWHIRSEMKKEREFACDDSVVNLGESPGSYAETLLHLAGSFEKRTNFQLFNPSCPSLIMIVRESRIEQRIRSVLNENQNRLVPGWKTRTGILTMTFAVVLLGVMFSPIPKMSFVNPASAQNQEKSEAVATPQETQKSHENPNLSTEQRKKIRDVKSRYLDQLCNVAQKKLESVQKTGPVSEILAVEKELIHAKIEKNLFLLDEPSSENEKNTLEKELRSQYIDLFRIAKYETEIAEKLHNQKTITDEELEEQKLALLVAELQLIEKFPDVNVDELSSGASIVCVSTSSGGRQMQAGIKETPKLMSNDVLDSSGGILRNISQKPISFGRYKTILPNFDRICKAAEYEYFQTKNLVEIGAQGGSAIDYTKAIQKVLKAHIAKQGFISEHQPSEKEKEKALQEYKKLLKLLYAELKNTAKVAQNAFDVGMTNDTEVRRVNTELLNLKTSLLLADPGLTEEQLDKNPENLQKELDEWLSKLPPPGSSASEPPDVVEPITEETPQPVAKQTPNEKKRPHLILNNFLDPSDGILQNISQEDLSPEGYKSILQYLDGMCRSTEYKSRYERRKIEAGAIGGSTLTYMNYAQETLRAHLARQWFIFKYETSEKEKEKAFQEYKKLLKILYVAAQGSYKAARSGYDAGAMNFPEVNRAGTELAKIKMFLLLVEPDLTKEQLEKMPENPFEEINKWLDQLEKAQSK